MWDLMKNLFITEKDKDKKKKESQIQKITNLKDFNISAKDLVQSNKYSKLIQEYDLQDPPLGKGAFAEVRVGIDKISKQKYAVKIIDKGKLTLEEQKDILKELNILSKLDHPHIVKVYKYYDEINFLYIITELMTGGELFHMICQEGYFKEQKAAIILKQILQALNYCHQNGIAHRDIKPENILLQNPQNQTLKIIDFGGSIEFNKKLKITGKIGTPYYVAPEVLLGKHNEKCDIWSCGVLLYVMLSGYPPFNGPSNIIVIEKVKLGKYNFETSEWKNISNDAKNFINKILEKNPKNRITAQQALNEKWIEQNTKGIIDQQILDDCLSNLKNFETNSKLQEAVFQFIVNYMIISQQKDNMRLSFQQLDVNHDGKLSREELIQGYQQKYGQQKAVEIVDKIMEKVDKNKNNFLDYSEWVMASVDKQSVLNEETLRMAFQMFDTDNSGEIDLDEIKVIFQGIGDVSDSVWQDLIKEADTDGNGQIDFEEFTILMQKMLEINLVVKATIV